jgi:hypothetical protein
LKDAQGSFSAGQGPPVLLKKVSFKRKIATKHHFDSANNPNDFYPTPLESDWQAAKESRNWGKSALKQLPT